MNITSYHSGSRGNLYKLEAGGSALLLECGVSIKRIKEALGFRLHEVEGCLVSHAHMDHSRAVRDLLRAGVDVYTSEDVIEAHGLTGHRVHAIEPLRQFQVGDWKIKPFPLVHDVPNMGFLIVHGEARVIFATDTHFIPHRFRGLTHIMLEAGYDPDILRENVAAGLIHPEVARRTFRNHLSIRTALGVLRANDMSRVEEIHLLHLSDTNSNAEDFARRARQACGRPVYVAGA